MFMLNKVKMLQALWISFYDKDYAPEQSKIDKHIDNSSEFSAI